jgi:hypothetical protein
MRLTPSDDLSAARWIGPRLGALASGVGGVIPSGFEAYARIAHPDDSMSGDLEPESLAALLDVLSRHTAEPEWCWFCLWDGHGWITGAVVTSTFTRQAADAATAPQVVHEAASAPSHAPPDHERPMPIDLSDHARVELPGRTYLLYAGPLDAALELGFWPSPTWFFPQSPNIFWPADLSWCVATEIDLSCTYVGGTRALIDELAADERLEVSQARLEDSLQ